VKPPLEVPAAYLNDNFAMIVAMGHKPDVCLRCAWALSAFSDHEAPLKNPGLE